MRKWTCAALVLLLVSGCASPATPVRVDGREVEDAVLAFVAAQQDDGREEYSVPEQPAAEDLAAAVLALSDGRRDRAAQLADRYGYRLAGLAGGRTALVPVRLPDDRGWGLYVVDPLGGPLAVEVPHPRADLRTERLGARLAERARARFLLVAGASRRADDGGADVAAAPEAVFTAVHRALAGRAVPALQLHGFADDSLPGQDLVVSPGAAAVSGLARRVAGAGDRAGLRVCRSWQRSCGRLEGRRNVQGAASARTGTAFVHLEASRTVREDGDLLLDLLLAAVDGELSS